MKCHIFPHRIADGPANMALDEALLDQAAEAPDAAYFRTYSWSPPTLSLGYFQRFSDVSHEARWKHVAIVRRPTGGGAIWHDQELTYAIILPGTHPVARPNTHLYRAVHDAVAEVLQGFGLGANRWGSLEHAAGAASMGESKPFLCFTDRDAEDIVVSGSKIVGSAQRRRRGVLLQHGSILLRHSAIAPELRGIRDLVPAPPGPLEWAELIEGAVMAGLSLVPSRMELPRGLSRRALEYEERIYRDRAWTERR